jgi:hypothetical protein
MPTLHRKTAKGVSEIETRTHRLPPRLRTALLMVDGRRSDEELVALLGGTTADTLLGLAQQGFIEGVESTPAVAAPASGPVADGASGDRSAGSSTSGGDTQAAPFALPAAADLASTRRDAVRALSELLGPAADTLSVKMEKAQSLEELHAMVQRAAQMVASMRGRALAEAYWMRFGPRG